MSEAPISRTRRWWFRASAGLMATLGVFVHVLAWGRSLGPNVRYEPPLRRRLGRPERFKEGATYLPDLKIYVLRAGAAFRALSAVCTHLGCTVQSKGEGYHCPCHGSSFSAEGHRTGGPAPTGLPWHTLALAEDGQLVVDLGTKVGPGEQRTVPGLGDAR